MAGVGGVANMAKLKLYKAYRNGIEIGEGPAIEWEEKLHFDSNYIRRMARLGMAIGGDEDTAYTFKEVGFKDGDIIVYLDKPRPKKEPKPKPPKRMTTKEVVAAARKAGMSYGMYVGLMGIK